MTPPVLVSRRAALAGTLGCGTVLAGAGCRDGRRGQPPGAGPTLDSVRGLLVLEPDHAYLNNGTLGPCPGVVLDATIAALRQLEDNPAYEAYHAMLERADAVRGRLAAFVGCDTAELAITSSTTEALTAVAVGADLRPGDRVLTTDQEHPGGLAGWEWAARHRGAAIDTVAVPVDHDEAQLLARVAAAITPRTRIVCTSHVTFAWGVRLPITRIAALAHEHGALMVVDGAQAPGELALDLHALCCDVYAASAHKWMLAPKGTGFLYVAARARDRVHPPLLSHGPGVYTAATGTRGLPAVLGLGAALELLDALGIEAIERRAMSLRAKVDAMLRAIPGLVVRSPHAGPMAAPMVAAELPAGVDGGALTDTLRREHAITVKRLPPERGNAIRVSTHVYNTERDIERLEYALRHSMPAASHQSKLADGV